MPLADINRHVAELVENFSAMEQGPPCVEVNFHGPPHCHPARDRQPLLNEIRQHVGLMSREKLGSQKTEPEKGKAHDQAGTPLPHQTPELHLVQPRPIGKIIVDGFFHEMFGLVAFGKFSQVDNEIERFIDGKLLRPAQNKILGASI